MLSTEWRVSVEPHFGFLAEEGSSTADTNDSSWWATWVQYSSDLAAIRVIRRAEIVQAEVELIRLADGVVPPGESCWGKPAILDDPRDKGLDDHEARLNVIVEIGC